MNKLIIFPEPTHAIQPSPLYAVKVNGRAVFVYPCTTGRNHDDAGRSMQQPPETAEPVPAAFASFDFSGAVDVEVRVLRDMELSSVVIRPIRHGIKPEIKGNVIRFTLKEPCKLSIEPNGSPISVLHLFTSLPEEKPVTPDEVDFYFGAGVHIVGHFRIPANSRVYLAGGAVLYGAFGVFDAANVTIFGRGILDGSRAPRKHTKIPDSLYAPSGPLLNIKNCSQVTVEGIHLMDSPNWALGVAHTDDVVIRNVRLINWRENGDGIDIVSCQRCVIEDCFVRSWDDALVLKGNFKDGRPGQSSRDIVHRNCVLWLDRAQAIEIGVETRCEEITNIRYENIDLIHDFHVAAIDIQCADRARVHNIVYENIRIEDPQGIDVFTFLVGPSCFGLDQKECGLDHGTIEDILLRNIEVTCAGPLPPSCLRGKSMDPQFKGLKVRGIVFENLRVNGRHITEASQIGLRTESLSEPPVFR
jgi:hypothetical protein